MILEEKVGDYSVKSFEQAHTVVGSRLMELVKASNLIVFNSQVQVLMSSENSGKNWKYQQDMDYMDQIFLDSQPSLNGSNVWYTLVSGEERLFGNWGALLKKEQSESEWRRIALDNAPFPVWLPPHPSFVDITAPNHAMISMVRTINNSKAVLRTSIEQAVVADWLKEIHNESVTLIYNEQGVAMYGQEQRLSTSLTARIRGHYSSWVPDQTAHEVSNGYRMISRGLPLQGWTLVQVIDEHETYKDMKLITESFFVLSLLSLLIFIGVTLMVTGRSLLPLRRLRKAMRKVGEGEWSSRVPEETSDEIGQIASEFNLMVEQIRVLINKLQHEEREKAKLYYESLLAQINPHFLFNTISSIKWTAVISQAHHVAGLLTSLGKILEMSTSRIEDLIMLEQEIDYVEHYMNLQYARFGKRVKLTVDVPESLMEAIIPKFIIQTLVENAIIHGFEQHGRRGDITIRAHAEGTRLFIFVEDNGLGVSPERLLDIAADKSENRRISGLGIRNVKDRLKWIYGQRFGVMFASEEMKSTIVRIVLPLAYKEEKDV
jgi:sensor histidine kinase YesM